MTAIVIDNSVFLSWCLGDEDDATAAQAMQRVAEEGGVVPRIWWYELRNALLMNERRGRISLRQVSDTLADSLALGIAIDDEHDGSLLLDIARSHNLTVYDAAISKSPSAAAYRSQPSTDVSALRPRPSGFPPFADGPRRLHPRFRYEMNTKPVPSTSPLRPFRGERDRERWVIEKRSVGAPPACRPLRLRLYLGRNRTEAHDGSDRRLRRQKAPAPAARPRPRWARTWRSRALATNSHG